MSDPLNTSKGLVCLSKSWNIKGSFVRLKGTDSVSDKSQSRAITCRLEHCRDLLAEFWKAKLESWLEKVPTNADLHVAPLSICETVCCLVDCSKRDTAIASLYFISARSPMWATTMRMDR